MKRIKKVCAAAAFAAAFMLVPCFSAEVQMPELYYKLSTNIVSPHISWAKPYYKGTLRVLVIAPRWGQRDTAELMERLDAQCTPVFVYSTTDLFLTGWDWGFENVSGIKKDAVEKSLNDALQGNYDVIILAYSPVEKFPKAAIDKLLEKVAAGTGLVYIYANGTPDNALVKTLTQTPLPDDAPAAISGIPVESLQFGQYNGPVRDRVKELKNYLSFYSAGKGKVALVRMDNNSSQFLAYGAYGGCDDLTYEYYAAYMINVILKAARKESGIQYPGYQPSLNAKAGQLINYTLKLENSNAPVQATVTASVRTSMELSTPKQPKPNQEIPDTASSVLAPVWQDKKTVSLPTGASEISFTIPGLSSGDYFLDVQIASVQKNMSWSAEKITVQSDVSVTDVKVTPSALDMNGPERHVQVQVTLNSPASAGMSVSATLLDNNDRVLDVRNAVLKESDTTAQFNLSAEGILSTLGKVRISLVKGDSTLSVNTGYFTVFHRPWDAFTFFAWGGGGNTPEARLMTRLAVSLGVDAFRGGSSIESLKIADVRCIPDMYELIASSKDKKYVDPCYSDPDNRIEKGRRIFSTVEKTQPFDPFGYLQGDEFFFINGGLPGACGTESCIKAFREYLKTRYGTIENLNKQWGFTYSSFNQIVPVTSGNDVDRARKNLNFSYQIDQWSYNWFIFADSVRFYRNVLKEKDPTAKLGFSTPLWNMYYRAYYWPVLMKYTDFFTPYSPYPLDSGDAHFEIGRSFANPGTVLSMHYGSYSDRLDNLPYYEVMPYALLLDGAQNLFWYALGFGEESGISPSIAPYPCFAVTASKVRELKNGAGDLFTGATRIKGTVAIQYSEPSFLFSFLVSGPVVPWRYNELRMCLARLGYDYEFVSDEQIVNGALSSYKAVFLPVSQCIGAAVAAKLKEFVEHGGILIANLKPGIFDEHGKYWETSPIGQLFGLKWKDPLQQPTILEIPRIAGSYKGREFTDVFGQDEKIGVDTSTMLDGASSVLTVAGAPVLTFMDAGKGTAICLNLVSYPDNMLSSILSASGVFPPVTIKNGSSKGTPGNSISGLKYARFSDGAALYCGFIRFNGESPASLTLTFGKKGHLYDLRAGKYLGEQETWDTTAAAYDAQIYALLPYKVEGLVAKTEKQEYGRGEKVIGEVVLNTSGGEPVRHVINLTVSRPDGMEVRYLKQNLSTAAGKAGFQIPLALNEPAGAWTLKFTDAATGVSIVSNVTVH